MLPPPHASEAPRTVTLPAGTVVLRRGQRSDVVYHVHEGCMALGLLNANRLAHQLGWLQGPCWIDPGSAVLGLAPVMDVVATSALRAQAVARTDFSALVGSLPDATRTLLRDLALAHRQQAELAADRLGKGAQARCAEWLLRLAAPAIGAGTDETVMVTLTQRKHTIARQLGMTPETLSRVLRHLREQRLIRGRGCQLQVLDAEGLRALAER